MSHDMYTYTYKMLCLTITFNIYMLTSALIVLRTMIDKACSLIIKYTIYVRYCGVLKD